MAIVLVGGLSATPAATAAPTGTAAQAHIYHENRSLGAITCLSMSFCMGVGNYGVQAEQNGSTFSQSWNGKTWHITPVPEPPLATDSLVGVACVSTRNCLAVGGPLSVEWNGTSWRMLPVPTGAANASLNGVQCPAVNDCIAVGTVSSAVFAQQWNGGSWTQLAPVAPAGSSSSEFNGISCTGSDNCVAVGQFSIVQNNRATYHALAESWNGKTWTMLPATPASLSGFNAVSCATVSVCVAVDDLGSAVWNGASWTALTIKSPTSTPLARPALTGVSCMSATSCIAVGAGATERGGPFAERWSGGPSWQRTPEPIGISYYGFSSVSCPGPPDCIAVGGAGGGAFNPLAPLSSLAEAWNGKTWRVLRTGKVDELSGVACPHISHCLITGGYLDKADVDRTLAEYWNSKTVRLVSPNRLAGLFGPVSCPSTTFCMALAGSYATWNGRHWTWFAFPTGFGDAELSCASQNFCVAGPSGQVWNGKTWLNVPFAQPGGANITASVNGMSCLRPHICIATGGWEQDEPTGPTFGMLAEVWNGSRWNLIDTPSGQQGTLGPVSCFSPTNCMTTGSLLGSPTLFAARWNGHRWTIYNLPGKYPTDGWFGDGTTPSGISCPTATSCMIAGSYQLSGISAPVDVAFAWNGHTWRRIKVPGPGGIQSLSCAAANQCVAVGAPDISTLSKEWNGTSWRLIKTIDP
jgi:hypothetical protein